MSEIKISVVTAVYNRVETVSESLRSLQSQKYSNVEHIIVDGGSTDGTIALIKPLINQNTQFISEPDHGIYDALNKGFALATGDIIGILHSDDVFFDENVLTNVVEQFEQNSVDFVYGDIQMITDSGNISRLWKSGMIKNGKITYSQIPHPALFLSKSLANKLNPPFDPSYRISADLKQQLIFVNALNAKGGYIPSVLVKMRVGGTSTRNLGSYFLGWIESMRAWNEVHGSGGGFYVIKKVISKFKGIRRF